LPFFIIYVFNIFPGVYLRGCKDRNISGFKNDVIGFQEDRRLKAKDRSELNPIGTAAPAFLRGCSR